MEKTGKKNNDIHYDGENKNNEQDEKESKKEYKEM